MDPDRFVLGFAEIRQELRVSEKWAKHLVSRADFPRPVLWLKAGRLWWTAHVARWIELNRPAIAADPEKAKSPPPSREAAISVGTTLEERIQARLELALLHQERANIEAPTIQRGMVTGGPNQPVMRLSVEDVSRIAARAAEEWAEDQR